MDVLVLIDKLDDLVHNAKPVPLTDQVRVDKEEIYDILDQMRATIPEEIKQARWIVKERQEMLAEAKREAERIVKEARERQEQLVSEEEVTKQAERAAEDIIEDARAREREIRLGAEDYADEILNTLEVNLSKFIAAVQRGRERLQGKDEPAKSPDGFGVCASPVRRLRSAELVLHRPRRPQIGCLGGLAGQVGREGHALAAEHLPALTGDADPLEARLQERLAVRRRVHPEVDGALRLLGRRRAGEPGDRLSDEARLLEAAEAGRRTACRDAESCEKTPEETMPRECESAASFRLPSDAQRSEALRRANAVEQRDDLRLDAIIRHRGAAVRVAADASTALARQHGCRECCGKYDNADERHTAVGQACGHELPLFRPPAGLADGLALKELRFDSEESFAPHTWVPRSPPPWRGLGVMRAGEYP